MFVDRFMARLLQCLLSMDVGRALLVLALVACIIYVVWKWAEAYSEDTS